MELSDYLSRAICATFIVGCFFGFIGALLDWHGLKEQPIHKKVISFIITLTFMSLLWWLVCFIIGLVSLIRFYGAEIRKLDEEDYQEFVKQRYKQIEESRKWL